MGKPRKMQSVLDGVEPDSVVALLQEHGLNPAEELIRQVQEKDSEGHYVMSWEKRNKTLTDLLRFQEAPKKPTDVGKDDRIINVTIMDYSKVPLENIMPTNRKEVTYEERLREDKERLANNKVELDMLNEIKKHEQEIIDHAKKKELENPPDPFA